MQQVAYHRAASEGAALALAANHPDAAFIAGGTDLLQLFKQGPAAPAQLIDISRLPLDRIEPRPDTLRIGALARLADVARHPDVRRTWPALAEAIEASASPQVRNLATVGGNLLQRTRCGYFRSPDLPCNKRQPGSGCAARDGENRLHAIFGASPHCAATHASDLGVALLALDASVHLRRHEAARVLPIAELFRLPGDTPERDSALEAGELIVAVEVPAAARRSGYLKVRDRASFEFAVVSVAVVPGGRGRRDPFCTPGRRRRRHRAVAAFGQRAGADRRPRRARWPLALPPRTPPTALSRSATTASRSNCCAVPCGGRWSLPDDHGRGSRAPALRGGAEGDRCRALRGRGPRARHGARCPGDGAAAERPGARYRL